MSSAFSVDPQVSFADSKQLLLFAIVPIAYRLLPGRRTLKAVDVMITAGALSAVYGIVQYGIFNFDNLGQRVQGTLGHYMTYSGADHAGRLRGRGARDVPRAGSRSGRR